jgi:hypothetical protein
MPRKKRAKPESAEPVQVAEPAAAVMGNLKGDGADTPKQLPAPEQAPPFEPGSFAARLRQEKPVFAPVPDGFINVASYPDAGIKVNKSINAPELGIRAGISGIQFAENRRPSREEADAMEVRHIKYGSVTGARQWEREAYASPGANTLGVEKVAKEIAKGRQEGIGR